MAKGFKDKDGKFRPTEKKNGISSNSFSGLSFEKDQEEYVKLKQLSSKNNWLNEPDEYRCDECNQSPCTDSCRCIGCQEELSDDIAERDLSALDKMGLLSKGSSNDETIKTNQFLLKSWNKIAEKHGLLQRYISPKNFTIIGMDEYDGNEDKVKILYLDNDDLAKGKDPELDGFDITNREWDSAHGRMYGLHDDPIPDDVIEYGNLLFQMALEIEEEHLQYNAIVDAFD